MRVLIAASIFPPDIGGPASYVPSLAGSLVARGIDVHVVCLADAPGCDDRSYPFEVTRVLRHGNTAARIAATIRALAGAGRGVDIVYANGLTVESRCAARLLRVPFVAKIVGDFAWERARNRRWFAGTIEEYQAKSKDVRLRVLDRWRTWPLSRAAAVITPSAFLQSIVAGWGVARSKIRVVYNALPADPPAPVSVALPAFHGRTVATICRLVPWKGVHGLIDAVSNLPGVRLVVVGEGPEHGALAAHALARGASDRVVWMGARSSGEVHDILRGADAFVLNSSYEGLPHVVLEAMRASVPVVATAVGGTPEVITDGVTGRLVPPGDTAALARTLQWILESRSEAEALAASALTAVRSRFNHDAMVDQTLAILAGAACGTSSAAGGGS